LVVEVGAVAAADIDSSGVAVSVGVLMGRVDEAVEVVV
jgi:hypothetical protein